MKRVLFLLLLALNRPEFAVAQGSAPTIAGFQTEGTVTAGYRFTDVKGREQKYKELFNLRPGFRLHDLTLYSRTEEPNRFADSISFDASGLGGDPFQGTQLHVKKDNAYDVRLNFRQTYYSWDRNDDQVHPTGLHGLTTDHDFATVRRVGAANVTVYATPKLRINFDYQRTGRGGSAFTTRTLDYFGAPTTYAGFLRANPFYVEQDIDETSNRITGGVSYSWKEWNVFYRAGYQRYNEQWDLRNPIAPERSINVDEAATANELVKVAVWNETRRTSSPVNEFSYNGKVAPRLTLRGGYIYYRFNGPAVIKAQFSGNARTTSASVIAPFSATAVNTASLKEPNHIIDQGFTLDLRDDLAFHADYRYSRFTMDNVVNYNTADDAGSHVGEERTSWQQGYQILDLAFEYRPGPKFLVRPGLRLMKRDLRVTADDVLSPQSSRPSKYASPLISIYYAPTDRFSLRGDMRNITNGGPYTRISPRTDFRTRWVARYKFSDRLSIENNFTLREAEYSASDFANKVRSNAATATYTMSDKFSVFGGFVYDNYLATSAVTFLRGTAPLSAAWRDHVINRVWQGGVEARPIAPLEFRISGDYLRTTGVGEISGELPISGPLRWPLVTATTSIRVPRVGVLSIDLQRTYYTEEIMRGDNFSANILGVRWTREF